MRVGDSASLMRRFTLADLEAFAMLLSDQGMGESLAPPAAQFAAQLSPGASLLAGVPPHGQALRSPSPALGSRAALIAPQSRAVAPQSAARDDVVPEPLIAALFSRLLGMELPGPGTGWLKQELHHPASARLGEDLHARVEITRLRPEKKLADLMCICTGNKGRLICRGRALMLLSGCGSLQS